MLLLFWMTISSNFMRNDYDHTTIPWSFCCFSRIWVCVLSGSFGAILDLGEGTALCETEQPENASCLAFTWFMSIQHMYSTVLVFHSCLCTYLKAEINLSACVVLAYRYMYWYLYFSIPRRFTDLLHTVRYAFCTAIAYMVDSCS